MLLIEDVKYLRGKVKEKINESTGDIEKLYYIEGIFSTPDVRNRNGRLYPLELWQDNVENYQYEIKNKTLNSYGEDEHPDRDYVIPEQAVIQIEKLEMRNNKVWGRARILNIPQTIKLKEMIDNNQKIGVSSRGTGTLNETTKVVETFNLITYDVVKNPSDYNAMLSGCKGHNCSINENKLLKENEDDIYSRVEKLENLGLYFRQLKENKENEQIEIIKNNCQDKIKKLEDKIKKLENLEQNIVESISNYINNIKEDNKLNVIDTFNKLNEHLKKKYK